MPRWAVIGGTETGGILVREGQATSSNACDNRLVTGALVDELQLKGDRLNYRLLKGDGPSEGWVSIKTKDRPLMERQVMNKTLDDPTMEWDPIPQDIWRTFPKLADGEELRPKSLKEWKANVNNMEKGEYWGIEFPFTPKMLQDMGPEWLTKAMHTAGTLPKDDAVTRFHEFDVKAEDVTKQDAENAKWGGAGLKILLKVEYKSGGTQGMFIKMPHEYTGKNERQKNSFGNNNMDWSEVTFYNVCGGRFGCLPFASPRMFFCDMARGTSNFINIVERIPYSSTGTMDVGPGQYYPAPEKYKDWALPNNGVDLYYAHTRTMAQFFGWYKKACEKTDQLGDVFGKLPTELHNAMKAAGPYNSAARLEFLGKALTSDKTMQGFAATLAAPQTTALGWMDMAVSFATEACPKAFPEEIVAKPYIDRIVKEAREMSGYLGEMNLYGLAIPEYGSLCHPNAQVDNAYYWKDQDGEVKCGLLDWGGVSCNVIPVCLGNGWMGAEPEVMAEHEEKLVQLFVDEYEKVTGIRFDCEDLHMCLKLAQCVVFFGCCANVGMCLRIHKKDVWATMTGRKDPRIDENFLLRCYWVQVYLWFKMWGLKNSPYAYFQQFMQKLKLSPKASPTN